MDECAQNLIRRERVLKSLCFEPTDRVPVGGGFALHPDFLADAAGVAMEHFWNSTRQTESSVFKKSGVDMILGLILPDRISDAGVPVEHEDVK